MPAETIRTPLTEMFGIKYPIILAGMNKAAGPKLAAAVTNAGGLGVIGGVNYTPRMLRAKIKQIKKNLNDPNAPFGVDLLLPKVGKGARATNYDYCKGQLDELIDIVINEGSKLFVSAVGVPPKHVVDRLHSAGIPVMNMIGSPKHVPKCLAVGVDIICAQGGEGGGHTGDVATTLLIPKVVDMVRESGAVNFRGEPVRVVAAGGIYDGRGVAMALSYGADAVWVGTRFICATEAGASKEHKKSCMETGYHDTVRTLIFTGRPLRVAKNPYVMHWETKRKEEMLTLCKKGVLPYQHDMKVSAANQKKGMKAKDPSEIKSVDDVDPQHMSMKHFAAFQPHLLGQTAGAVNTIKPAKEIVEEMMTDCIATLRRTSGMVAKL